MKSRRILGILAQAQRYKILPSQVIKVEDEYTAFCFDEACAFIMGKIDNKEEPNFNVFASENEDAKEIKKEYRNFGDYYKDLLNKQ